MNRFIYLGLLLAACSDRAAELPMKWLEVGYDQATDRCSLKVDGNVINLKDEKYLERVADEARRWPERSVGIRGTIETPYKCVGGVVFALQRAGKRVGFIAEPPPRER